MSDHEQRTAEWHQARLGKVTASCVYKVMAKTKTGYGADRANYMAQIICERLTGVPTETFVNAAMQRGTDLEPQARAMYSLETGNDVVEVGFIAHPTIKHSGASPDGLIDGDGLLEIKVPNPATHIATLRGAEIDRKYILQMQWQMACTGRAWCDFSSFCDVLPAEMQTHIRRVPRDNDLIAEIETEITGFLGEVDAGLAELRARYLAEAA
jgi:putative phage-type endonuclease